MAATQKAVAVASSPTVVAESKKNKAATIWITVIGIVIIFIVTAALVAEFRANGSTESRSEGSRSTKQRVNAEMQIPIPLPRTVMVGTEWYNPNVESLPLNVFGQPQANTGNGVVWQVRFNYDDRTIRDMKPIDSPIADFVTVTNEIQALEVRVKPMQRVTRIPFVFIFRQWQSWQST